MKRTLTGTALAVLASAALAAAQAQSPQPSDPPSSPPAVQSPAAPPAAQSQPASRSSDMDKTTTWTGCLEAGTAAGTYVLSSASASGAAQSQSKAPQPAGAAAAGDKFLLSGAPASFNISSHVNHKVEVTGTEMASAGGAQSKAGQAASADSPTRTINVKSAKMISDRCTTF
jgi:opacity protein-like surface antigen